MPKLKPESTAPEIIQLEQGIEETESAIASLNSKITALQKDEKDFESAITALDNKFKNVQSRGDLSGGELVKRLTEDIRSEKDKGERLSVLKQSLDITRASLRSSQEELAETEARLAILQDDLEWERDFSAHADEFKATFEARSDEELSLIRLQTFEREDKIVNLKRELYIRQEQLKNAVSYLNKEIPNYIGRFAHPLHGNPNADKLILESLISQLQTEIREIEQSAIAQDKSAFRAYVRSRLQLRKPLDRLIAAQTEYSLALADFRAESVKYPEGLDFDSVLLGLKNQVEINGLGRVDLIFKDIKFTPNNPAFSRYPASNWQ